MMKSPPTRQCSSCRETRKIYILSREICRPCYKRSIAPILREQRKAHYRRHRKAVRAKNLAYYHANSEAIRAQQKKYRDEKACRYRLQRRVVPVSVAGWGYRTNAST
jgi:hypothetical protein